MQSKWLFVVCAAMVFSAGILCINGLSINNRNTKVDPIEGIIYQIACDNIFDEASVIDSIIPSEGEKSTKRKVRTTDSLFNTDRGLLVIHQTTTIKMIEPEKTKWASIVRDNIDDAIIATNTINTLFSQYYRIEMARVAQKADVHEESIILDFIAKNSHGSYLEDAFIQSNNYRTTMITDQDIKEMRKAGFFWAIFNTKYPRSYGMIELSRVGFDSIKTMGMLYIGHQWGRLAGRGYLMKFKKIEGRWVLTNKESVWLS